MKKIYILAAALLSLTACDNAEDTPLASQVAVKITGSIGDCTLSRAMDNKWEAGDKIGIISETGATTEPYLNLEYITEKGDGVFKGKDLFFYKSMTLMAYYPFTGPSGKLPGVNGIIDANTRAANQSTVNQPLIDFLWDSKTGVDKKDFSVANPHVDFKFAHKMSKVTFMFQSSDAVVIDGITVAGPVDVAKMTKYSLEGLVLDGTFNTKTGVCAVKEGAEEEELPIEVNNVQNEVALKPLILFPQTLKEGHAVLHIVTNELNDTNNLQNYKCNLSFSDGVIKPGYHYIFKIKVTKIGLIVGQMSVVPWEEESRFMTATIDGNNVFND